GQVLSLNVSDSGAEGTVKGNFKDHYTIQLIFEEDLVSAVCDCPVEDEWCKHAVAVGLTAVDQHLWEKYLKLPYEETEHCGDLADTADFEGAFRFMIDWDDDKKTIS